MQPQPYRRKTCPGCRYPMLALKNFDGVSSADADRYEGNDSSGAWLWGADVVIIRFVYEQFAKLFKSAGRKKKVQELKRDVLPQYPDAVICPQCLHVEW